jgi:hypothetical protein
MRILVTECQAAALWVGAEKKGFKWILYLHASYFADIAHVCASAWAPTIGSLVNYKSITPQTGSV